MPVKAQLLGGANLFYQGAWQQLPPGKTSALVYYLISQDAWVSRDALIFLFWPDTPEDKARNNLRRILSALRKLEYADHVEIEATRLRLLAESDVKSFREALAAQRLARAVQLYRGDLLEGFHLTTAREFESWLELERRTLHSAWRLSVLTLAGELEAKAQFTQAAAILERLHRSDYLDEALLRHFLTALYRADSRQKALDVFDRFEITLEQELDSEPEPETVELIEAIRRGDLRLSYTSELVTPRSRARTMNNLPSQATPFIGREVETTKLSELLQDPACRLLSIIGAGGVGKTRLALEVAGLHLEHYPDGVWFVACAAVTVPERMIFAVADAVELSLVGQEPPIVQLLEFLRVKEMLLVLDNLEHLLPDMKLPRDILQHAPKVTMLATSRERLNVQAERVFTLEGLALSADDSEISDAMRLFRQTTSSAGLAWDADSAATVDRICQLTEGMPLAIELAAKWLRVLPLADIAHEVETGIDVLQASARDRPERHQSIRAVFDHSYDLLSRDEQATFRKLSVFQGGFRRDAATVVAGSSLAVLANLVDKSLVRVDSQGRYSQHPLIHHYAQEHLAEHLDEKRQTEGNHGLYYLHVLQDLTNDPTDIDQLERFELAIEESANIKRAWYWTIEENRFDDLQGFVAFYASPRLLTEVFFAWELLEMYSAAVRALDEAGPAQVAALGNLHIAQAGVEGDLGFYDASERSARQGLALLYPLNEREGIFRGWCELSHLYWLLGRYSESKTYGDESLDLARRLGNSNYIGQALVNVANVIKDVPAIDPDEALAFYEAGLEEIGELGYPAHQVGFTHLYAFYLLHHGRPQEAARLQQANLKSARQYHLKTWEMGILDCLAMVAHKQGDHRQAYRLLQQSHALIAEFKVAYLHAYVLANLGKVSRALGDDSKALEHLTQSFDIGKTIESDFSMATTLVSYAELRAGQGRSTQATEWLSLCLHHRSTESHARIEATRLLEELQRQLSPEEYGAALERGRMLDLCSVVQEILAQPGPP